MKTYLIPLSKRNSAHIAVQTEAWRRRLSTEQIDSERRVPFITISRQFGCGAFPLAEAIANRLSEESGDDYPWAVYDRALVQRIAEDHQLSEDLVAGLGRKNRSEMEEAVLGLLKSFTPELKVYRSLVSTIRALAMHGRAIIIGRGGVILTRDMEKGLHIRIIASFNWRVDRVKDIYEMKLNEAREYVSKMDAEREQYLRKYLNADISDPQHYHLVFNNSKLKVEQMVDAVVGIMKNT